MEMTYIQKGSNNPNMNNSEHSNYLKEDIHLHILKFHYYYNTIKAIN